jgi:cob(I)alamin adenosyltransferase
MKDGKYRVSRVTTRTGDKGETGLANGQRLPKHDKRIELLGTLDELNSAIGYLVSLTPGKAYLAALDEVQQTLFDLGSEAAHPEEVRLYRGDVTDLDAQCDLLRAELPPLREFLLPGGTQAAAWCHMCRTLARRAERRLTAIGENAFVNPQSLAWLNRLSDFFFILARHINRTANHPEPEWRGPRNRDEVSD